MVKVNQLMLFTVKIWPPDSHLRYESYFSAASATSLKPMMLIWGENTTTSVWECENTWSDKVHPSAFNHVRVTGWKSHKMFPCLWRDFLPFLLNKWIISVKVDRESWIIWCHWRNSTPPLDITKTVIRRGAGCVCVCVRELGVADVFTRGNEAISKLPTGGYGGAY